MSGWQRVRQVINWINLSTLFGLFIAKLGRARLSHGPRGLIFAYGYRIPFPIANAFTLGNVVLTKNPEGFLHGCLLDHENRHATQYAFCLGIVMLPLYVVALAVSYALCGHQGSWNIFERLAGLDDGGYPHTPVRWRRRVI
ncbi:hypothetical protein [Spongiactinospora sp. TRM90649]|uniref:hypothetical protein n=1 Tax=Spongiactinospora sp. TRM90649 TaxID=3031114 RepID=UPI0023F6A916|nr:hypothetical protein [Spongiactinospora sp. TRM90649]MDF5754642.1 hypothetical protein [Spongiactinospora sp. TRM90649]